jgi:multiple sugar transport system substrate-binding protein
MRTSRFIAAGALAVATALAVTACSSGGNDAGAKSAADGKITGDITLQTWALTPKFTDYLNGVIADFQKQYPGTKVTLLDQPGDGYSDKVLSQASAGTLPDVVNLPPDFALPLAQQGLLEDLSKDVDLKKTYVAGAVDAYHFAGVDGDYGFPWYLGTDLDYWNKSMLDQCGLDSSNPPKTTDDLFAQAKTMHDNCPSDYLMSRMPGIGDFTLQGIDILSKDGKKFVFDTPEAEKLVDTYADAFKKGYMPPTVLNGDYLGNSTLFTQGKVAWTTGGSTSYDDFVKNNPSLKDNVVVSPALSVPPVYVQGLSVAKNSKHLATAIKFGEFLTNADNQNAFGKAANVFPSTLASAQDPYYSTDDGTVSGKARVIGNTELKDAKVLQPYVVNSAMSDYFNQQLALAIKGQISSHDALSKAQDKMNQLLEQAQ